MSRRAPGPTWPWRDPDDADEEDRRRAVADAIAGRQMHWPVPDDADADEPENRRRKTP